jgi:hypothetical protein
MDRSRYARPHWRIGECDALRDHALDIRGPRRGHEIPRTLDAQAGITRETFFVLRRARRKGEIGELMDDCLRRRGLDRARERIRIEHIDHDRLGAEGPQRVALVGRASGADDGMSDRSQQRREPLPYRPTRPGQKYFHCVLNRR